MYYVELSVSAVGGSALCSAFETSEVKRPDGCGPPFTILLTTSYLTWAVRFSQSLKAFQFES